MLDNKVLNSLNLAFSRPKDQSGKVYVQDLIQKQTELVKRLIDTENGCVYLCGATAMGAEVQKILKDQLGEDYFKQLQKEKRLIVELWSD